MFMVSYLSTVCMIFLKRLTFQHTKHNFWLVSQVKIITSWVHFWEAIVYLTQWTNILSNKCLNICIHIHIFAGNISEFEDALAISNMFGIALYNTYTSVQQTIQNRSGSTLLDIMDALMEAPELRTAMSKIKLPESM